MKFQFAAQAPIEADFALDFSVEDEAARQYRLRLEFSDPDYEAFALGEAGFEIEEGTRPRAKRRRPRPEELPGEITITRFIKRAA